MSQSTTLDSLQNKQLSPKDRVKELLEQNKMFIAQALPKHMTSERMLRCAMTAFTSTPDLKDCYIPSLIGGIIQCSIIGLEPNTPLGHAYLIPFNNRKKNRKEVQVIFGYAGLIDLMRRSGEVLSINANVVREGDIFEFEYGLNEKLRHIPGGIQESPITHFYAYANLKGGGQQYVVMTKSEVDQVMMKTQSGGKYGPWHDHYQEMGKKTAIRRISKYLPKSIELASAVQIDEYADLQRSQNLDTALKGEYTIEDTENETDIPQEVENNPFDAGYGDKLDVNGEIWNKAIHAASKTGHPVWSMTGEFRKRRKVVNKKGKVEQASKAEVDTTDNMTLENFKQLIEVADLDDHSDLVLLLKSLPGEDQQEGQALLSKKFF